MEERPVTPPGKGFKMTGPGQNYHNESTMPPGAVADYVSFEARALGGGENDDMSLTEEERKAKIAAAAAKRSETAGPEAATSRTGCDHLVEKQNLMR